MWQQQGRTVAPFLAHRLPHPPHGTGHQLSEVLEAPTPMGGWEAGTPEVGAGAPREGLAEAGAWWWLEGGSCSGNRGSGSLPKHELSLRAEDLPRVRPGLMPPPHPAFVGSQSRRTRGAVGGGLLYQEVAQRWSKQVHGKAVWDPPVGQNLGGASRSGAAQPDGMDPLEAASDQAVGAGEGVLTQEVTLA